MAIDEPNQLKSLSGVGPKLSEQLNALGICRVSDLLFHLPLRYEDRTRIHPIGSLAPGQRVLVEGQVDHAAIVRGRRSMLVVSLSDGTGRLTLRFFHFSRWQKEQLKTGTQLRCFGEVRAGFKGLEMTHPQYRRMAEDNPQTVEDRLTPIYPGTEGMKQALWTRLTDQALERLQAGELELEELLPRAMLADLQLPELREALQLIHRPPPDADVAALVERRHPAQQRLAMEELLAHHASMLQLHRQQRQKQAPALPKASELEQRFVTSLPFQLTAAQQRVTTEIAEDLADSTPMLRLLQGDVGSGKTVVAALAALRAMGNAHQVAVTAPTEILAEQHFASFQQWLAPLGIEPVWLSGRVTGKARDRALQAVADGAPLVIGTHALMQEGVRFSSLGLAIIDEQHRFGVNQRLALREKGKPGEQPHQLIMTATPIPRTLAMTAYAGLETSIIDELPPGRQPVTTVALPHDRRDAVIRRIRKACGEGRQAYWVCTLIEESDAIAAQAAEDVASELAKALPELKIGLVHGRLKAAQKQQTMEAFAGGRLNLLVATTVIEVGVDVPNASLMVIENAERLGLSQLHQLRGRVGRGTDASACVLLYTPPLGALARERLDIMRRTNDGFEIAERDLELRGPGEVLGTRQTGQLNFRVADLARDAALLRRIPTVAEKLLAEHPQQVEKLVQRWIGAAERFAAV